jgi:hypothetical protein
LYGRKKELKVTVYFRSFLVCRHKFFIKLTVLLCPMATLNNLFAFLTKDFKYGLKPNVGACEHKGIF